MNEIVKAVNAVPAGVDARVGAKLEPLNSRLEALGRAIDSFAKLAEDVQKIREEFTGFRSFRERIEGREKSVEDLFKEYAIGLIVAVAVGAFTLGGFLMSINGSIGEMKDPIGEVKGSIDKLQSITYPPVPFSQKARALRAAQSPGKTPLDGAVNFYVGEKLFRPAGVVATARPMKDEGRVPIQHLFRDRAALEGYEKVMGRLREDGKPMRRKAAIPLG